MVPLKVAAVETVSVASGMGVGSGVSKVVGVAVGIAVGIGVSVVGTGACAPHADIPARSTRNAKADIDRGHRTIPKF